MLELSSFQLDGMYRFRADVAVLMNITPTTSTGYDHSFERYADAKCASRTTSGHATASSTRPTTR
ncbi:MAG: hypothetical protein ACLS37_12860 [Alistipes sp.]